MACNGTPIKRTVLPGGIYETLNNICESIQIILDTDGRILSFNPFAERISGYSEEEALAHTPWEILFDQANAPYVIDHFNSLPQTRAPLRVTIPLRCRNGEVRHVKWSVQYCNTDGEKMDFTAVSGIDITPEIELQNADRRLQEMVHRQMLNLERQNRHLEKISHYDHLTGIYNRRFFDDILHEIVHHKHHRDVPLSLLMCDIDFFKQYNDTHGHIAGDSVLHKIAQILSESTRNDSDVAARYGGDEFALILPLTGRREARKLAERIVQRLAQACILHGASSVSPYITLSIGIATSKPSSISSVREFVNLADRQLYLAKKEDRDTIVSASHFGPPTAMK